MTLVVYFVFGRLLVWTLQTSGATKWLWKLNSYLTALGECDFCVGVWIFPFLAYIMGINFLAPIYIPFISEIITGIASSFATHLARMGWNAKYGITYLEN
ncbi:hypothetical protein LCGC14_0665650 [marine sediment metagenome]|uniref:DUF1360 domain-containing protein n=1 Tax=marine sediment metagenome TaxID=412755 RepID=A0A0F9QXG0_9ZZZZ